MAEKVPKIKITEYDVGKGNYFVTYPSFKGYHAYGSIAGKKVTDAEGKDLEGKDLEEIQTKFLDFLAIIKRNGAIGLSTGEGLAAQTKEGGLGKLEKISGDKK